MEAIEPSHGRLSRHDTVGISIDRLVDRGVIGSVALQDLRTPARQSSKAYVFEGEQGKRDSIIAVAQLTLEFTAKLMDRWQELRSHIGATMPHWAPKSPGKATVVRSNVVAVINGVAMPILSCEQRSLNDSERWELRRPSQPRPG
jgi:hypothetical protein